jgi:hypothetical protein
MSQAQVLFFHAAMTASVYSVCEPSGPTAMRRMGCWLL